MTGVGLRRAGPGDALLVASLARSLEMSPESLYAKARCLPPARDRARPCSYLIEDGARAVGLIDLYRGARGIELGIAVLARHRRHGHARAALDLMCAELTSTTQLPQLQARTLARNAASRRLLLATGFAPETTVPLPILWFSRSLAPA